MKKTLIFSASMVFLALLVMLVSFGMREKRAVPVPAPVLLLAEDDTGAFFRQLRLGAQKAVSEAGTELITEMIRADNLTRTAENGAIRSVSGAVVYVEDAALRQRMLDILDASGIPVVLIGCQDENHASIYWSDEDLGRCAAALASQAKAVYIAGGSESARRAAQETLGARAVAREALNFSSPEAAIVALDAATTLELCQEKTAAGWQCALYGVDPGESRVACLEEHAAQALLFASPYAAGYKAALEAVTAVWQPRQAMAWYPVWAQHMYDAQNVKLVFPLLN